MQHANHTPHQIGSPMRKYLVLVLAGVLFAGACSVGGSDDDAATTTTGGGGGADSTETTEAVATFPPDDRSTGVTADSIKVGITYVDLAALGDVVDIDHGDYEAAYNAVIDDINAGGGINGRRIDPVFAPVVPIGTAPADEACTKLTEDEQVFAVVGFANDDAPLCYVNAQHDTPLIGSGVITDARLADAKAPWFSVVASQERVNTTLIDAFAADGVFDDATVGVIALPDDEAIMDDVTVPALEDAGVTVADTAVIDAPADDQAAAQQQVGVIAERFDAAGIDTVVTVGNAGLPTAQGLEPTDYRPRLVGTGFESLATFVAGQGGFDAAVVADAITGGYATSGVQAGEQDMQECAGLAEQATGTTLPDPVVSEPGDPEPFVSVYAACLQLGLFEAIATAAGDDLNNGTFGQAGYDLGAVDLPGDGGGSTYGPDSLDGDMPIYLLRFDADEGRFVSDTEPTATDG